MHIDSDIKNRPFEKQVRKLETISLKKYNTIELLQNAISVFPKEAQITRDGENLLIDYLGNETIKEKPYNDECLQIYRNMFQRKNQPHDLETLKQNIGL